MKVQEFFDIIIPLRSESKVSKEKDAIKLFEEIEETVALNFQDRKCFKYLAVIEKEKENFCLELAYDSRYVTHENEINEMVSFIRGELNCKLRIVLKHEEYDSNEFDDVFEKLTINMTEMDLEFEFHNDNESNTNYKKKNLYENITGEEINLKSENAGAIGGILRLSNYPKDLFLITNYHVIFKSDTKINEPLYLNKKHQIANTFWGMFNSRADIAIAKLKNKNYTKGTPDYCFGHLKQAKINDPVQKYGPFGFDKTGSVYSSKAILKIKSSIFINQLIIKDLGLKGGESGTLITEGTDRIKNIIGLHFGGTNGRLDFANNLHQIFSEKISAYYEKKYDRHHPEIKFKSFH